MHTSEIKFKEGIFEQEFTIHHNGDFSGDVIIQIPDSYRTGPNQSDSRRVTFEPEIDADRIGYFRSAQHSITIPFEVLQELVGRKIISDKIGLYESLSGIDVIKSL
jgi:hypothetical protein